MKCLIGFLFLAILGSSAVASGADVAAPYRLDEMDPAAKVSFYSSRILGFLEHWPPPILSVKDARPVTIRAIRTPGHSEIIGMVKHSEIQAPLAKVEEVTEQFENYPKIWEDILEAKVVSRDRNRAIVSFTRKAPAFFLSKIRYRTLYTSDKTVPGRIVYRQQLIDGNSVKSSDSIVVLEKAGEDRTRVAVLNFFEGDFGPLRAIAEGKIWKKCVENGFKDDVAFRAYVEHPDWSADRISDEADKVADRFPIDEIEYTELPTLR